MLYLVIHYGNITEVALILEEQEANNFLINNPVDFEVVEESCDRDRLIDFLEYHGFDEVTSDVYVRFDSYDDEI